MLKKKLILIREKKIKNEKVRVKICDSWGRGLQTESMILNLDYNFMRKIHVIIEFIYYTQ